jgi:hypothetical protein
MHFRVVLIYGRDRHDPRWSGFASYADQLAAVRRLTEGAGRAVVRTVLFDPQTYAAWRGRRGRTDTRRARREWAREAAFSS